MHLMGKRVPEGPPELLLLPQPGVWVTLQDVEDYARACIDVCGPEGWRMQWDDAVRRLGCCKINQRVISISRFFAETYLFKDPELIRRTVLHELAHALAWEKYHERNHGPAWHYMCYCLGISDERSVCHCDDFAPRERRRAPLFALCHKETGEVYRYYYRRPRLSAYKLRFCYIPGKKKSTYGKLNIIDLRPEGSPSNESA